MVNKKAQALFFLGRYVRDAEERSEVSQEDMATEGLDYATRQVVTEEAEKHKTEAEALRWAYTKLSELPDDED